MSRLEQALAQGRFVVTGELPPVDGGGLDAVRRRLEPLARLDAVNATDNTAAHAHASPVAVAIALLGLGVEPVMQLVCRDRNRLALESDLVGAALHGIENVCCLTGDDVTAGDEPEARRVFDLDGPQLVRLATTVARGEYLSGRRIEPAPRLFVGAVENPFAPPVDLRVRRALKKALAGARFLQLQIGYRPERLEAFMREAVLSGLVQRTALLPTICLLPGASGLRFMDERYPASRCRTPPSRASRPLPTSVRRPTSSPSSRPGTRSRCRASPASTSPASAATTPSRVSAPTSASRHELKGTCACTQSCGPTPVRSSSGTTSRSASSASGSTRPAARRSRRRCARATSRRSSPTSSSRSPRAMMLDVNAGIPLVDEAELLASMIRLVQEHTVLPVCIDSSVIEALDAGLAAYQGKALVNSVTGEDERLDEILPLVARHGAAVIGLANDETGIPETPEQRLAVARKIVSAAGDYGIPPEDVLIDPLAMTVGADTEAVNVTLRTIRLIRDELGANMCLGASNVSFGLPNRHAVNAAFLPMAMDAGLTSAIMNALAPECVTSVKAADLLLGHDEWGASWIAAFRAAQPAAS